MSKVQSIKVNQDIPTGILQINRILTDEEMAAIARLIEKGANMHDIALLLGGTYQLLD